MIASVSVVPQRYYDSVRLMHVSQQVASLPGVDDVLVAMGTDLNRGLLTEMGFEAPDAVAAGPDDLIIAVRAADEAMLATARAAVDEALHRPVSSSTGGFMAPIPHRTVGTSVRTGHANIAVISVPGEHAFVEAMDALRHGAHVMVFSDNVSVQDEVRLKQEAARRELLVMGPDCGTAIVNGAGLGFANATRPGPVGITGASGTGIQELCVLLDAAGVGVRHALGTGSRDLSAPVGGSATLTALAALDADPSVEVIVVVSKPPDPGVAATVREAIGRSATPVVAALLGTDGVTLDETAVTVLHRLGRRASAWPSWHPEAMPPPRRGMLRGLFSGGTLCAEARSLARETLGEVGAGASDPGHRLVDYGGDEYTRGRAHPMIDSSVRLRALLEAASDPASSVILLDLVLGYGAHPDPAAGLAPGLEAAASAALPVVVSLCGASGDPQGRDRQAAALVAAGAEVFLSNAAAARRAVAFTVEGNE